MDTNAAELQEKIRQQFDFGPYPRIPIDRSPKKQLSLLYFHNLVTPYYLRNHQVINPDQKVILDAGCGTGYGTLTLAEANPGAKIIGIDISEQSLDLARKRLSHYGFEEAEFHQLSLYDLPSAGWEFDYINCDELLYLFPEPAVALKAMKAVLKPQGIIRSNLHSKHQRHLYFRAQEVFHLMGLFDENPEDMEIEIALDTMKALKNNVQLKARTWDTKYEGEDGKERVLMNYLFQGDKGYTIPDLFAGLRAANLDFISMVHWRQWDLMSLFKEPDNLPVFLAMSLPDIAVEDRLHLFELLHPVHRLLDFWCGHPEQGQSFTPISEWTLSDWQKAKIHLHPQLKIPDVKQNIVKALTELQPFEISRYLPVSGVQSLLDSAVASCLLPLFDAPQSMPSLVERWQTLRPVDPVTFEPISEQKAFDTVKEALMGLENYGYLLVEG